jgi:L-amino acid N-acyltransferase YncA
MVVVRQICEEDAASFRDALDIVCRERRFLEALEAPPMDRIRAFVRAAVKSGFPHFVADDEGKIVGWCDAVPGDAATGAAHVAQLGMGLLESHRGRKIGQQLLKATIERARLLGLEKIELGVYSSNSTAIALYRRLGFEEEGRKKRGRLVDGIYYDVLLLALELNKPNQLPDPTPVSVTPPARAGG